MRNDPVGVDEAGANILGHQPVISFENRLRRVTGSKHSQDMLDGETPAADDGLPAFAGTTLPYSYRVRGSVLCVCLTERDDACSMV